MNTIGLCGWKWIDRTLPRTTTTTKKAWKLKKKKKKRCNILPCFSSELKCKLWVIAECDSPAWLSVFAPDFNESKSSGGSAARRGNIRADYSLLSSSFIERKISDAAVRCIKIRGGSAATGTKGIEKDLLCSPPAPLPRHGGSHVETCQVWLRIIASSWSCIHHPLHLAPAHMGRRAGASGTLPVAHIKRVWRQRSAGVQFICASVSSASQRFVLHVGPDRQR